MTVTIIGGGIVGATLALALAHLSKGTIQINLVEAQLPESLQHPSFDTRVIALAQGTCHELTTIGVWPALVSCATAITKVEISNQKHICKIQIAASDYYLPALGYVVELYTAGKQLFNLLKKAPGMQLYCPAKFKNIRREQNNNFITLDNGVELHSQLVVAADGMCSPLGTQCGIHWRQFDYQQIAVIANIRTAISHNGKAFERFTSLGPLALLPMSTEYSSLIWCLPIKLRYEITSWNEEQFCYKLQKAFGLELGRITAVGKRRYYPLSLSIAQRHIAHRLALVGNAAQTLHPIGGQGCNLGLRDVMTLAETLIQATTQGKDVGDYTVLLSYLRRRQSDQANIINITNKLIYLFTSRSVPLVVGRNLGLLAMAYIPSLRNILIRKTLGWVAR